MREKTHWTEKQVTLNVTWRIIKEATGKNDDDGNLTGACRSDGTSMDTENEGGAWDTIIERHETDYGRCTISGKGDG